MQDKKNYNIHEPWLTLDPWQVKYIETIDKNCFLLCGRQSGKTAAMSIKFGEIAIKQPLKKIEIILMIAETEKQAYNLFFKTLMYLEARYPKQILRGKKGPTKHMIQLKNGSIIMCYAAGLTGSGLRTYTLTRLAIDEAAPMATEIFVATMPMLSVTGGFMDFSSTPRGKEGYFYECSKRDDFEHFYISAEDCPRHSKEFLAAQKDMMTEIEYHQEYLAEFMAEIVQVFKEDLINEICVSKRREVFQRSNRYYLGVDVAGMGEDESTFEIFDRTNPKAIIQVENIVTRKTRTTDTTKKIIELNNRYDFRKEYIDSGGLGVGVCDQLRLDDANKNKVVETNNSSRVYERDSTGKEIKEKKKVLLKEQMYNNLLNLMEMKQIKLLDDVSIKNSLASVRFDITGGIIKYRGDNDHIAEGLIRAAQCIKDKSLNIWVM